MSIVRSLLAVIAGIAVFSIALLAMLAVGNAVLGAEPEWINRTTAAQIAWLGWNVVAMTGGGYVTAWIAPNAKVGHAIVMGVIQALFTAAAMQTAGDDVTPRWLWIGGMVATIPAAWLGARIRGRSKSG